MIILLYPYSGNYDLIDQAYVESIGVDYLTIPVYSPIMVPFSILSFANIPYPVSSFMNLM